MAMIAPFSFMRGTNVERPGGNGDGVNFFTSNDMGGPAFSWVDIRGTGGTHLTALDDTDDFKTSIVPAAFSFPFYGSNYTTIYIGSNGIISFANNGFNFEYDAGPLPNGDSYAMIMPLCADLIIPPTGNVYWLEEASKVTIQYDAQPLANQNGNLLFQAVLNDDGSMLFYYNTVDYIDDAYSLNIGCQNVTGATGLNIFWQITGPYSFIAPNMAISVTART